MDGHGPAIFVGDAPALDFLNSVATPVDAPVDWIDSGEGLVRWLDQAGLVPADTLKAICAEFPPSDIDAVALQARELREWFRSFVKKHKGRRFALKTFAELAPLNRLLERDETFSRIVLEKETRHLVLKRARHWRSVEALLLPIAETLAQFVCTEDFSHVKACEGVTCTLLFADHTRGRARRWCSMAICGNRAKQAAHRERRKAARR